MNILLLIHQHRFRYDCYKCGVQASLFTTRSYQSPQVNGSIRSLLTELQITFRLMGRRHRLYELNPTGVNQGLFEREPIMTIPTNPVSASVTREYTALWSLDVFKMVFLIYSMTGREVMCLCEAYGFTTFRRAGHVWPKRLVIITLMETCYYQKDDAHWVGFLR